MTPEEINRLRITCFARAARRLEQHGVWATSDVINSVAHESVIQAIRRGFPIESMNIAEHWAMYRGWHHRHTYLRNSIKSSLFCPHPHKRDGWIVASKFRRAVALKTGGILPDSPFQEGMYVSTCNNA